MQAFPSERSRVEQQHACEAKVLEGCTAGLRWVGGLERCVRLRVLPASLSPRRSRFATWLESRRIPCHLPSDPCRRAACSLQAVRQCSPHPLLRLLGLTGGELPQLACLSATLCFCSSLPPSAHIACLPNPLQAPRTAAAAAGRSARRASSSTWPPAWTRSSPPASGTPATSAPTPLPAPPLTPSCRRRSRPIPGIGRGRSHIQPY